MNKSGNKLDISSIVIILLTLILFIVSLFVKGLTHDLLLETGIFLVSAKLIIMSFSNKIASDKISMELSEIKKILEEMNREK